jgi:hypothetical protein
MSVADERSARTARNDLAGAIVAGLAAGVVQSMLTALFRDLTLWAGLKTIVLGVAAYFVAGVIMQRFWRNRLAPNWFLTSLVGTLIFVGVGLGPAIIKGWYDPYNAHRPLMDYLAPELDAVGSVLLLFNLVTLPITAIFHFAREIIGAAKKWHDGSEPTSILRGE